MKKEEIGVKGDKMKKEEIGVIGVIEDLYSALENLMNECRHWDQDHPNICDARRALRRAKEQPLK